ncbi:Trifunctional UDP-glucose 4,6-dehydratase [Porphyridium purpureum]|uniref:Trifunctional UDP-glucose 4,6-dehydratase n=1 Tax=Porphyridium purpureum TaxID=35688 RepID=A0A5J4YS18_PORPP|nr:Trifunctional UDP-glucose 4,6-dehydratase [Porphyridium purpureum]|eukprot:POR7182..scf229_5
MTGRPFRVSGRGREPVTAMRKTGSTGSFLSVGAGVTPGADGASAYPGAGDVHMLGEEAAKGETKHARVEMGTNQGSDGALKHQPKCILLTGGAGFIGSHVAERLVHRYPEYKIVVLDRLDYCGAPENLRELEQCSNFKFVRGDIRSKSLLDYLLRAEQIDTVMHFAASTHVDNSFQSSISFTSNNVLGTHVLLECAREYGRIQRFMHVSTDEVYGGETDMRNTEESMLAPTNPYACTKAAAEFICRAYSISYGLPIVMTRGNNVYGPRQYPDKLIAKSATLLAMGKHAFIHGDGRHRRSYIYVVDCAEAFDVILHRAETGGVYNLGSEQEISNLDVVRRLVRLTNSPSDSAAELSDEECDRWIDFSVDRAFNDRRYPVDMTRLQGLGWQPRTQFADGLAQTAQWYADPANLVRWPGFLNKLVAHPALDTNGANTEQLFFIE